VIGLVWLAYAVRALVYVLRFGCEIPYSDAWRNVPAVVGEEPITLAWLWEPIVEHRIPLSRLAYVGLMRLSGYDFRAGMVLNVLLLAAAAWLAMRAASAARGRAALTDALLPVALLGLGQFENLLWSMQMLFVIPASLFCLAAASIARAGTDGEAGALVRVGICSALLPLADFSGLLLSPWLVAWIAWVGARRLRAGDRAGRRAALFALGCGAVPLAVGVGYAVSWRHPRDVPPYELSQAFRGALEVLSSGLGPFAWPHYAPWAAFVVAAAGAALVLLALDARDPERRVRAVGLAFCILAGLGLAAAIGFGRGMYGPGAALRSLYTTLMACLLCSIHLGASTSRIARLGSCVSLALLAARALAFPANAEAALAHGRMRSEGYAAFRADVAAGLPLEALAARNGQAIFDDDSRKVPGFIRLMERHGIGPFRGSRYRLVEETRPFAGEELALPATAVVGDPSERPAVELDLGGVRSLRGVRLRFALTAPGGSRSWFHLRWARSDGARSEFSWTERSVPLWIASGPALQEHTIWVYDLADRLQIEPCAGTCSFALERVTLLLEPGPAEGL